MSIEKDWEMIVNILEILGNKTRVEILKLLSEKECYVSEISRELDIGQQAILRHLDKLSKINFLSDFEEDVEEESRGRGRRRKYYRISEEFPFKLLIDFSQETFNIALEQEDVMEEGERQKLLQLWPGLIHFQKKFDQRENVKNKFERLKYVSELIDDLNEEYGKHQLAIKFLSRLIYELEREKENIKTEI